MLRAHLDPAALAAAVGVDVKTVTRWLAGRIPHQRTRLAVADALGETEADLWPQTRPDQAPGAEATAEVVAAYAHRADIPHHVWAALLTGATTRIDLLGYAYRSCLSCFPTPCSSSPTRPPTAHGSGSRSPTPTARTSPNATPSNRSAAPTRPHPQRPQLLRTPPRRARRRDRPAHRDLYNSVFRFDHQMIVTPHLYRARGYQHPALHLRELSPHGIFAAHADQFEQIWQTTTAYPEETR
ncbi:helix-turn-helix domain-containing protein [Micromonospora aurantiaca]|nr:helix-turn-helix domain-containing protein [Micromonospora aurantiaca]